MSDALPALSYLDDGRALLEPVRRHWPLLAILVANLLAAVVIFWAGKWVGETNRYDGCLLYDNGARQFWACPTNDLPPAAPVQVGTA